MAQSDQGREFVALADDAFGSTGAGAHGAGYKVGRDFAEFSSNRGHFELSRRHKLLLSQFFHGRAAHQKAGNAFRREWFASNAILPYNIGMSTLTVTARGQVTFRKKVMQHLGVKPGGKIELDLLPDGRGVIRAARRTGKIQDFFGVLAGKTKKVATIEEINEAAARGWAGQVTDEK